MSGICGILRLDAGQPLGIEAMAATLHCRGPEDTRLFHAGSCALGHTRLTTTPEAADEVQPLTHAETGCTIVADLRLDNRRVLLAALDMNDGRRPPPGDAELVLLAYLRWGENCLQRLLGDFAFAIWDPRARRVFCGRDHLGMKPLAWFHLPGRLFALASLPSAVVRADGVPARLHEGRIADFLEGSLEAVDMESTWFQGVRRLPPAHALSVDERGVRVRRYWRLEPGPPLRLSSDAAYAEAFLEIFTDAVDARLRAPEGTVGSMLSGGMDSGSIVAVASRRGAEAGLAPLPTFSAINDGSEHCIETRTVYAATRALRVSPHYVGLGELEREAGALNALTRSLEDPFDGSMTILRAVYARASRSGIRVLCDGAAGDLAFSNGDHVSRLLRRGRWYKAWQETAALGKNYGMTTPVGQRWLRALARGSAPGWLRAWRWRPREHERGLCTPAFAARADLAGRQARERSLYRPEWRPLAEARAHTLQQGFLTAARERYDRTAGACAIEPRDPYMDLRVLAFCLRLPQHQLTDQGWHKILQRRAMAGLLPDAVRWRRGKEHLGWRFTERLAGTWSPAELAPLLEPLSAYVDRTTLNECRQGAWSEEAIRLAHLAWWHARHAPD